jgi:hypothetical protein
MGAARKIRIFESEVQPVRIDELKIDEKALQSRAGTDPEMVQIYAERRRGKPKQPGTPFPPVLVFIINGIWWLADGFHRVAAALKLGEETIPAIVRRADSMVEAIDAGAAINKSKENLRGYQEEDNRKLAELYIRCGAGEPDKGSWDWSDSEISRKSGINCATVAKVRLALLQSGGIPLPERIWKFSDGTQIRKHVYKRRGETHQYACRPDRLFASVGGELLSVGGKDAEEKIVAYRHCVEATKNVLENGSAFRKWLAARATSAQGIPVSEFLLGGTRVGVAYVASFHEVRSEAIGLAICASVLALHHLSWVRRAIVVGYRDGGGRCCGALDLAAALSPPVEHMTPEEFVECALAGEFGPKPDGAGGSP